MKRKISVTDTKTLTAKIARLSIKTTAELKREWHALYGIEAPPRISRDLLMRAVAYRIQVQTLCGLKPSTRRLLARVAADAAAAHRGGPTANSQTGNGAAARVARHRTPGGGA